jgi:hypothetical protein
MLEFSLIGRMQMLIVAVFFIKHVRIKILLNEYTHNLINYYSCATYIAFSSKVDYRN